jgi:hypothetical protein
MNPKCKIELTAEGLKFHQLETVKNSHAFAVSSIANIETSNRPMSAASWPNSIDRIKIDQRFHSA